jgi:hypothetical protein
MLDLKCPKCGYESAITAKWNRATGDGTSVCRFCFFKSPTYVFIEAYQNAQENVPEYDPCYDPENGYY